MYNDYSYCLLSNNIDVVKNKKPRNQRDNCVDSYPPTKTVGHRRIRRWLYY